MSLQITLETKYKFIVVQTTLDSHNAVVMGETTTLHERLEKESKEQTNK